MSLSRSIGLITLALAAACGGGNGGGSGPGPTPTSLAKAATATGDSQVASPSATLPNPFRVIVRDQSGTPMANVDVTWAPVAGGGSITPTTAPTDANGVATATRTLGPNAGAQTATGARAGLTGSPVTFTAFSEINGAMTIAASGPTPTTVTDTVLSTIPVAVTVTNHSGVAVPNVMVSWSVSGGGGGVSQAVGTTDVNGVSSVNWTMGATAGNQAVQATVTGLAGSPVTFSGGRAGNARLIALNSGNNQVGPAGSALGTPHSVIVHDGHGNPRSGVVVTWAAYQNGGSVSSTSPTTGANGIASVVRTLGTAGVNTDTARVNGLSGSPVGFSDTAGAVVNVDVRNNFFSPADVTIAAGGFVVFTWAASPSNPHTVTSTPAGGPLNSSQSNVTGFKYTVRLVTPGTYNYLCTVHGAIMSGSITVN
ncbi:MAG: hypothetical protein DMD29_04680 [Gemmatimonadetes bacterium]|nr:MAG: hypothetical protein DMD29_04680 [Gemmatimonadota bacterium]